MTETRPEQPALIEALREIQATAQDASGLRRRWFHNAEFDLFVWQSGNAVIRRMQLCYTIEGRTFALDWDEARGDRHYAVDEGESRPLRHKMSPVLLADGQADLERLARRFATAARDLEPAVATAVASRLRAAAVSD